MKKRNLLRGVLIAASLAATPALSQKLVTPGYLFNSDPTCRQIGDTFWLFTTQDPVTTTFIRDNEYYKGMLAMHAFTTKDFDHWVDHGSIITGRDVNWNAGDALWDGDAGIPANGSYYAYVPFRVNSRSEANYGTFRIGVFTSGSPTGPYKDVYGAPMKTLDGKPLVGLSPTVIQGDDGEKYLIWGSGETEQNTVRIAKLNPNMVELAEAPRQLQVKVTDACGEKEYFESPILIRSNGRWVLTWVAYKGGGDKSGCDAAGSSIRYASSSSMFGPFDEEPAKTLIYPSPGGPESVQAGFCTYKGRTIMPYHLPYDDTMPYKDHHRQVAVTELVARKDGSFRPVHPETDRGLGTPGVSILTLDAFAPRREAAEFHARVGATGEPGLAGEWQMKMKPGGYLRFNGIDFGAGASKIHVEVSSNTPDLKDAVLQVRLDNPEGPLVGTVAISETGGLKTYKTFSATISAPAKGKHDVVLVARGEGADPAGHLFNVTSFGFEPRQKQKKK